MMAQMEAWSNHSVELNEGLLTQRNGADLDQVFIN